MQMIRSPAVIGAWRSSLQETGKNIAFVPTMGALHEGHLALIREAREQADQVVLSIFVNPTQFDRSDDLKKYPRTENNDLKKCEQEKVDVVFMPTREEIYPQGFKKTVAVPEFTKVLCGASRTGHFEGVATVVLRLFEIVQPTRAIFGEKDYQQLLLIRWLVREYKLPIEIVGHPIVREPDGLAMSSRNRHLSPQERNDALVLYRSIQTVQQFFQEGERSVDKLTAIAQETIANTSSVSLDYAEIRDAETLATIKAIERPALYATAASVGSVRLIDNCVLRP